MCVCVCVCVCRYADMHTCVHTHTYIIRMYVHTHTFHLSKSYPLTGEYEICQEISVAQCNLVKRHIK